MTKIESVNACAKTPVSPIAIKDRQDSEDQRNQPADNRPEHEQKDDQRCGKSDPELSGLQIVLRQGVEVVRERVVTGDVHREAVASVLRPNHRIDRCDVPGLANLDQHGVPVRGHGATGQVWNCTDLACRIREVREEAPIAGRADGCAV